MRSVRRAIEEIKPGLDLGVYILPPEFIEVAQDAGQFADQLNFLSPMAYFEDWGYPVAWVYRNVVPQAEAQARGIAVIPVLATDWSEAAYREVLSNMQIRSPRVSTLAWFLYGKWSEAIFQRIDRLSAGDAVENWALCASVQAWVIPSRLLSAST